MQAASGDGITELLKAWSDGDPSAREKLIPLVVDDLRRIAKRHLNRERSGHSLQTTALVNEAYVRLVGMRSVPLAALATTSSPQTCLMDVHGHYIGALSIHSQHHFHLTAPDEAPR
jgi:hypothetical protein